MYTCINGWTKEKMIERFKARNTGNKCSSGSACYYRSVDNTNACAVGVFIPDGHVTASHEYAAFANALLLNHPDLREHMPLESEGLAEMQRCHDNAHTNSKIHAVIEDWINKNVA